MKRAFLTLLISLFCLNNTTTSIAQVNNQKREDISYPTGCVIDTDIYNKIESAVQITTRSYGAIPPKYSLKKYCPTPQHQGDQSTCSAWSTTYAARTILKTTRLNITNRQQIDDMAFSPSYVFNQVKLSANCKRGAITAKCLDILVNQGAPRHREYTYLCSKLPTLKDKKIAKDNRISSYRKNSSNIDAITFVKKGISNKKPIVVSMECFKSFYRAQGVWQGNADESLNYHSMTIVGYDDYKDGGAVEIMNSWGTEWGNKGFIWVKYSDLQKYVLEFYEMSEGIGNAINTRERDRKTKVDTQSDFSQKSQLTRQHNTQHKPKTKTQKKEVPKYVYKKEISKPKQKQQNINNPYARYKQKESIQTSKKTPITKSISLAGSIQFVENTGQEMLAELVHDGQRDLSKQRTRDFAVVPAAQGNYEFINTYPMGTRFRIYVANNEPAYLYLLGSEANEKLSVVFPYKGYSPLLDHKNTEFAFPDEHSYIEVQGNLKRDFIWVLYAKEPLEIEEIKQQLEQEKGHAMERLNKVLKGKLVSPSEVQFDKQKIAFNAKSQGKTVVAFIVEMRH